MLIACPACDVSYDVPDSRLRPGRSVRCARCGEEWEPALAEALPELRLAETEQGFGTRIDEDDGAARSAKSPAPAASTESDKRLRGAWIASGMVLLLLFGSAVLWRGSVMTGWPASQRLYALFGMRPAPPLAAPPPGKTANAAPAPQH